MHMHFTLAAYFELHFRQFYHRAYDFIVRSKIVEATMPVNPYDDRKVSMWRPHGNGDLDIVRASYTRRKANVTEALAISLSQANLLMRKEVTTIFERFAFLLRLYFLSSLGDAI